jgi:hypothetical protein
LRPAPGRWQAAAPYPRKTLSARPIEPPDRQLHEGELAGAPPSPARGSAPQVGQATASLLTFAPQFLHDMTAIVPPWSSAVKMAVMIAPLRRADCDS